jgi:hypothetical protein
MTNAQDVNTVSITLTFDPNVIQVAGVSPGTFMQQGGVSPTFVPRMDPQTGRVDIAIARPGGSGATGSGLLAGIQFKGVKPGTAQISVTAVAATAAGQPVRIQTVPATVVVK